jgi:prepilin-type N-terminal cleavage/methylation domain-containing protein
MTRRTKKQEGFTLLEILVVMSIFAVAVLLSTNLFITITKIQRKTASEQRLQGDARFVMELISKDIRLGRMDYDFYGDTAVAINLMDKTTADGNPVQNPARVLAVRDSEGERIVYRRTKQGTEPEWNGTGDGIEVCIGSCIGGGTWERITPEGVRVLSVNFYIFPDVNPFTPPDMNGIYLADEQPHVTFQVTTQGTGANAEEQGIVNLQSTSSMRIYER